MTLARQKNARAFEVREVRWNGLPLAGLHMITGPGRLEFMASPATGPGARTTVGGFKSLSGMDSEVEIVDPGIPGSRRTLSGRVTAAVARPRSSTGPEYEEVTFVFNKIS